MLLVSGHALQSYRQILGVEAEGARPAFVRDSTACLNEVHAVRPTGISGFDLIIEIIDERWKFDVKTSDAGVCHGGALGLISWTAKEDLILHVALHLPHISRMGFENVHGIEIYLALVLFRQFVQGGNLPPKRRSSIATEDQHNGPRRPQRGKLYGGLSV
jgi:hypothetical protein